MLYVHDDIPASFKYLCDYGSNYFILTNDSYSSGCSGDPDILSAYLCYNIPSFSYVPITYTTYESVRFSDISNYRTNDLHFAADFPIILITGILLVFCLMLIFNGLTRLITRGGIVFPS